MSYIFLNEFRFGTSTAATQTETACEHNWQGLAAMDGYLCERTTDHKLRFVEDASIIASLAPTTGWD